MLYNKIMKKCKRCNKEIPRNNYCGKCYTLNFRERHPGRMEELCSSYYQDNKDRYIERAKKRNKENPEAANLAHAKWMKKHDYAMQRYNSDINFRLIKIQRARIRNALKGLNKSQTTQELIGCTVEELKIHLESKFTKGMTWDTYGKYGWHVDHIVPISKFNLEDESELKRACHYSNLQPMWWRENLQKRDKGE